VRALETTWLRRPDGEVLVRRRESGNGAWVVFLHGAGMDGHMFDAQLPAVPDDWGICVWDARGHGGSSFDGRFTFADLAGDLAALLQTLPATRIVLVGQSMGGNLAQFHVATHPGAISELVLIGCTDNHGSLSRGERVLLALSVPILAAYPWRTAVRQSAAACGTTQTTRDYAERTLTATGRRRFLHVLDATRQAIRPDPSYRLPVPTLLVLGEFDRSGNIAAAMRSWPDRDPQARLVVVAGAGHNANQDSPDAVNAELGAFLGW
jgi:pimeloyl-ACP methyl ester carboxylesterase